jgi:hypothetical protein
MPGSAGYLPQIPVNFAIMQKIVVFAFQVMSTGEISKLLGQRFRVAA